MSNIALMDKQYTNEKGGFSKDNKYNRSRNEEYERMEKELKEAEEALRNPPKEENLEQKKPVNDEDAVFKKRYADLRSYASKKEAEMLQRIRELEEAVKQANKAPTKYPKTEEEVKEWMEQYPDVAGIIQTIAGTVSEEKAEDLKVQLDALNRDRLKLAYDRAYTALITIHPDFPELAQTEDFQMWLQDQSPAIRDTINNPSLDEAGVKAAAATIKLYKVDNGIAETKKKEEPSKRDAAKAVSKSISETPASDDGTPRFTESQIQKMSSREYEAKEKQILEAMKKGPPYFVYDITGGAR